jgi:small nuclear ribonucleoprotein (snRNP)-like protein
MTDILMQGPQFAKQYVTNYLQKDIPNRLTRYRNGWGVDDYTLPDPGLYLNYEPIALDTWPTVITVAISTNSFDRVGYVDGGNPLYRVSYSMRTYVWVKTEGSAEVTTMRDRLTTVLRSALLDYPNLQLCDTSEDIHAEIDESNIREEYSDLTLIKGDRVLAGAYIGYDLSLNEVVYRMPVSQVAGVDIEAINLR